MRMISRIAVALYRFAARRRCGYASEGRHNPSRDDDTRCQQHRGGTHQRAHGWRSGRAPFQPGVHVDLNVGDTFDFTVEFLPGQQLTIVNPLSLWASPTLRESARRWMAPGRCRCWTRVARHFTRRRPRPTPRGILISLNNFSAPISPDYRAV